MMKNSYITRRQEETYKRNIEELPLAYIWDRLAAFVVDLIVVSILANIFLAPFKKKIQAAILNEHDGAINFYVFCITVGACLIFILYHTVSVYLFRKTIGKKLFSLEVAPIIYGSSITIANCFVRAISLLASILLFFFPLLEIFSNRLRRPMHEKLSDSYVKGLMKTGGGPSIAERLWVRFVYIIVLANVCVLTLAQIFFFKQDIQNLSEFITQPEYLCEDVSVAKDSWPLNEVIANKISRLDIALTLFGIDAIDEECLGLEAQRAMSYGEELDKAYLAKAFIYDHNTKLSNKYLKKVCELNKESEPCLLTKMIGYWSEKDWKSAETLLNEQTLKSPFMKVWAIKHYDKTQNYKKVLALVETLWPNRFINDFIGKHKTIMLWNTDKPNESKGLFQSTYAHLGEEEKIEFLTDTCNLEIERNCSINSFKACKLLVDKLQNGATEYIQEKTFLTYVKTNKCGMIQIDDVIAQASVYIDDPKIQMYLAAVKAQTTGQKIAAKNIYKNILKSISDSSFLNYEVRSNLADTIDDQDLEEQMAWWLKTDGTGMYHRQLGTKFLKILAEKRKWQLAEPVANKFLYSSFRNREQSELMAVVFYNLKKYSVARKILESMTSPQNRAIASQSDFEQIKRKLLKVSSP